MDIHGPGVPGPCVVPECGAFAIAFAFVASKHRACTNVARTNDTRVLALSWETGDSRVLVTGMDHK